MRPYLDNVWIEAEMGFYTISIDYRYGAHKCSKELREYSYSPDPILRCYINKADSLEKRPLGSLLRVSQI